MNEYLAYRFVVAALLLAEANFCCQQLHFTSQDIKSEEVSSLSVRPPELGFGGRISTERYEFDFLDRGQLWRRFCGPGSRYISRDDDISGVRRRNMDNLQRSMELEGQKR